MDNIPKFMASLILIMFCLLIGVSLIITNFYIDQARSYHDSIIKTVSASDFSAAKIQECVEDAQSKGFGLSVAQSSDGYTYKVDLTYSITVPLFGTWYEKTISGYAIDYAKISATPNDVGGGVGGDTGSDNENDTGADVSGRGELFYSATLDDEPIHISSAGLVEGKQYYVEDTLFTAKTGEDGYEHVTIPNGTQFTAEDGVVYTVTGQAGGYCIAKNENGSYFTGTIHIYSVASDEGNGGDTGDGGTGSNEGDNESDTGADATGKGEPLYEAVTNGDPFPIHAAGLVEGKQYYVEDTLFTAKSGEDDYEHVTIPNGTQFTAEDGIVYTVIGQAPGYCIMQDEDGNWIDGPTLHIYAVASGEDNGGSTNVTIDLNSAATIEAGTTNVIQAWSELLDEGYFTISEDGVLSRGDAWEYGGFENCYLVIPEGVTALADSAFYGFGGQSITVPASVTSVGEEVFHNCANLVTLKLNSATPPACPNGTPFGNSPWLAEIIVPVGCVNAYESTAHWDAKEGLYKEATN